MGGKYDYDKTSNQDGGFDFGDATPFAGIGKRLSERNAITGYDHIKTRAFVPGGRAVTSEIGEFTKTIIDADKKAYDRSFWFMYPRFKNVATPNKAYFDVPADTAEPPSNTLLLPASGTQGLPVTIQASGAMSYLNCGKDFGLTEYINTGVSSVTAPHSLRYTDSARADYDLLYYKGVWFRLAYGGDFYKPRAVGMNKKYIIAMRSFYAPAYSVMMFLIPKARLDVVAGVMNNMTIVDGEPVFVGYDVGSVGNDAVKATVTEPLTIDCTEYSQGVLMTSSEAGFWDAEPYTCWPSPTDDNVFSTSWRAAPSYTGNGLTRHFKINRNVDGSDTLALHASFPFTIPGTDSRSETYTRLIEDSTSAGADYVWGTINCSGNIFSYKVSASQLDDSTVTTSEHTFNKAPAAGNNSTGTVTLYQFLANGSPLTVAVEKSYQTPNFFTWAETLITHRDWQYTGSFDCAMGVQNYVIDNIYTYDDNSVKTYNGNYTITATYSWGRQYTLESMVFEASDTSGVVRHYTAQDSYLLGVAVSNVTVDVSTKTRTLAGRAKKSGETPLVIDPTNQVQIWVAWIAGHDARRTALTNFVPNKIGVVTAENYASYVPLDLISATLHIEIGLNYQANEQLYSAAGTNEYTWLTTSSGPSGIGQPGTPSTFGSGTVHNEYPSTINASWAAPTIPIPLLQYWGDGNPSNNGIYLCTRNYLVITVICDVSAFGYRVYDATDPAVKAYRHKAFRLTRNESNVITGVAEVDIQTEFGIAPDAVFSWVFLA